MNVPGFSLVTKMDLVRGYLRQFHALAVDDCANVYEDGVKVGVMLGFNIVPLENGSFELHLKIDPITTQEAENGKTSSGADNSGNTSGTGNKGET